MFDGLQLSVEGIAVPIKLALLPIIELIKIKALLPSDPRVSRRWRFSLVFEFGEFSPKPISSASIECLAFDQHLEICACFGRIATGAFKPSDDPLLIFD